MSGNKAVHYRSDEQMNRSELATFLRRLADRVEQGTVVLKGNGRDTEVDLPDRLELEVKYQSKEKAKGGKHQLELEIEWSEGSGTVGIA